MVDGFAKTPRYVLLDGSQPTSPVVVGEDSDGSIVAIFGFSGKPSYDVFWKVRSRPLTPFPLIARFLQSRLDLDQEALQLVVLDATSPQQQTLQAATFQAVLEAFQHNSESVLVSHQLICEGDSPGYHVRSIADTTLGLSR